MIKMFKQNIKYVDFNGNERQEDFYFHLSSPEVIRLEAEVGEPIDVHTKNLSASMDLASLLAFLEKMILSSYGKKTTDGKSFTKSKELREEFEYSQAYAEFFEMLIQKPDLAQKFGAAVADNGKKKNQVEPKVENK
jgi:hypothetical protein